MRQSQDEDVDRVKERWASVMRSTRPHFPESCVNLMAKDGLNEEPVAVAFAELCMSFHESRSLARFLGQRTTQRHCSSAV